MRPDEKDTCAEQGVSMQQKHPPKFDDCPLEEKVKRLHLIVKELRRALEYCYQADARLSTKVFALEHHQHSEKGDCMIRIEDTNRDNQGMGMLASNHDLLA